VVWVDLAGTGMSQGRISDSDWESKLPEETIRIAIAGRISVWIMFIT